MQENARSSWRSFKDGNFMNFIDRYSIFSRGFYLLILFFTIPYYLVLYGASGHQFHLSSDDILAMTAIETSFTMLIIYLSWKKRNGLGFIIIKIIVALILLFTLYEGIKAFLWIIQFEYGDDTGFIFRGLSYFVPLLFVFCNIIILLELFLKKSTKDAIH